MSDGPISRRDLLGGGLACLALAGSRTQLYAEAPVQTLSFRLKETAGLRRFGYPVHTLLPVSPDSGSFRLEQGGKPVPAQFRAVVGPGDRRAIALDFNASLAPLQSLVYSVQLGGGVAAGPEPKQGMSVTHLDGLFRVANGSVLAFLVPDTLSGFLKSVQNGRLEFIRQEQPSAGLYLQARAPDVTVPLGTMKATVTRQGPIAVGLRFEGTESLPGGKPVRSVVDLTFPNSKSWVEARWSVDDPEGLVALMGIDLRLLVEGAPTLVDLGAGNTVYGQVRGDEAMVLQAGRSPGEPDPGAAWEVLKVTPKAATGSDALFASATSRTAAPAEGWAHVIDRSRCTAFSVAEFGKARHDALTIGADGRSKAERRYCRVGGEAKPAPGRKSLRFWLHFFTTPVQVGAATSPQAMLAPLEVEWERS
jgi:hypothetical protein